MYACPSVGPVEQSAGYGSSEDVYSLSLIIGGILVGLPVLRLYAEVVGRVRQLAGIMAGSAVKEGFSAMSDAVGEWRPDVRVRPPVEQRMSVGEDVKAVLSK